MSRDVRSKDRWPQGRTGRAAMHWRVGAGIARGRAGRWLGPLLALLLLPAFAWATTTEGKANDPGAAAAYFATTPQLEDALTPLQHLPPEGRVSLRALVATVPDPIETRMGKSFDMVLAAMLSAYQARGYELDGFAFSWRPRNPADGDATMQETGAYRDKHRSKPSLLVFRKDEWRRPIPTIHADVSRPAEVPDTIDVVYELVFLVGDAPSFGIQPRAFDAAARCALALNGVREQVKRLSPATACDRLPRTGMKALNVMGPTYSGSMQSLAVAIGRLVCDGKEDCMPSSGKGLQVNLISPSASVPTNVLIGQHQFIHGVPVTYRSLSWTLQQQMLSLAKYLCRNDLLPDRRIVFLVEESTFGRGAKDVGEALPKLLTKGKVDGIAERRALEADLQREKRPDRLAELQRRIDSIDTDDWNAVERNCVEGRPINVRVKPFSPNISSIRAEHSRLRKEALAARQKGIGGASRLLELDMTSVERGSDLPPVFQPSLSSRSDELMLYRLFDTLRIWGEPNVVVIVATDVRDRLFLLSEVRKALPAALPVMLEADYLMVHPDYRATSRGAIVVPSRDPLVCVRGPAVIPCPSWGAGRRAGVACAKSTWPRLCELGGKFVRNRNEANRAANSSRSGRFDTERHAFSTDLAANTFRAVYLLAGYLGGGKDPDAYMLDAPCMKRSCEPKLYVATMAGFESLDGERRSMMVAADSRLGMQRLWYLAVLLLAICFLLVGAWLLKVAKAGGVMSNFVHRVIFDSRWLTHRISRKRAGQRAGSNDAVPADDRAAIASLAPPRWGLQVSLLVVAGMVVLLSAVRLWQVTSWGGGGEHLDPCLGDQSCRFSLAHGRDITAVLCIGGLYACLALIGVIRLCVAGRRYDVYGKELGWPGAGEGERPWLIPVALMLLVLGVFFFTDARPMSVDGRLPWLFAMVMLVCGAAFLVTLGWHMKNLGRLTLRLSKCIPAVQKRKGLSEWPSPRIIQEPTQTAFNLSLSRNDIRALRRQAPDEWMRETLRVAGSNGFYPPTSSGFDDWQGQLVAELKLFVVAIRFSAWCAMAAPLAVLLLMSAYTPVYVRWLKAMSVSLLLVGFACTVIVVLRLEKDAMIGPMFTRHGDDLSFGGALRALWPKFVAMGVVLVPLVLPDAMDWVHALVRSINSLG